MLETLHEIDRELFFWINHGWANSFFDWLMPHLRNKHTWIPLYVLGAVFAFWKWKWNALWMIIGALVTFAFTDYISSSIIKPAIGRLRPCNDPALMGQVRLLLEHCGGGKSFTSSHASNHFGLAAFIVFYFYPKYKWLIPVMFGWALSVALAQVYVGVHYPVDIAGGAVLGTLLAILVWLLMKGIQKRFFDTR